MGVSENRGPKYRTLNSRILIIRTPQNKAPLIFGNSHIPPSRPLQGLHIWLFVRSLKEGFLGATVLNPKPKNLNPKPQAQYSSNLVSMCPNSVHTLVLESSLYRYIGPNVYTNYLGTWFEAEAFIRNGTLNPKP